MGHTQISHNVDYSHHTLGPPCKHDSILFTLLQTASSASFLLYEIAKYPELQERLVQEISSVVGDKKHPSLDDLQKMSLLRNCVKETLRMYVPVAGMTRTLAEDTVLMGYQVPAGVSAVYTYIGSLSFLGKFVPQVLCGKT